MASLPRYHEWCNEDLQAKCIKQGLPYNGVKADMVGHLYPLETERREAIYEATSEAAMVVGAEHQYQAEVEYAEKRRSNAERKLEKRKAEASAFAEKEAVNIRKRLRAMRESRIARMLLKQLLFRPTRVQKYPSEHLTFRDLLLRSLLLLLRHRSKPRIYLRLELSALFRLQVCARNRAKSPAAKEGTCLVSS
ncbi:hypothetical protein VTL71DRAFT_5104 [Oculimacula yallundae]|uniref:SAP domain-containing protein n=1 Tax=Oculimacula yallundae TaxID=86028 RepID=A0ABR4C070_9HELO